MTRPLSGYYKIVEALGEFIGSLATRSRPRLKGERERGESRTAVRFRRRKTNRPSIEARTNYSSSRDKIPTPRAYSPTACTVVPSVSCRI